MSRSIVLILALILVGGGVWYALQMRGPTAQITAAELERHITVLSSDEFEGRAPATPGGKKTVAYISEQFKALGLKPGMGTSYSQLVPMVELTPSTVSGLEISGGPSAMSFKYLDEMVVMTRRVVEDVTLADSEMVFVGYGIVAPEYDWNDYADVDVTGKTVVILVNDPGFATGDPKLFGGNAMTYYGRWTYKYEEAARQGATAVLIIHETKPAAYPWGVVRNGWSGPQLDLEREGNNMSAALIEGWVGLDAANELLTAAGQNYGALKEVAKVRGFKAIDLGLRASVSFKNSIRRSTSANVVGILEGRTRPDEAVLYMAHWDHLGRGEANEDGDDIFNGAVDNATGVAALLELAQQFTSGDAPERSILFIAVTGEESGLLGSAYYGENPIVPHSQLAGAINMDALNVHGPTHDIIVVGHGKSELEEYLARAAERQGRVVKPEPTPEKGYFYRSDHFNLAKVGIPALYAEGGEDSVLHGAAWGKKQAELYTSDRYHQQTDVITDEWDLSGMVDDVMLYYEVGQKLANSDDWPNWYKSAEFRAIRDESRKSK